MDSVDLRGKPCPIPVIEVKKLLAGAEAGTDIVVLVDNDIARQNLQKLAEGRGHGFAHRVTADGIEVTLAVRDAGAAGGARSGTDAGGLVVAVGSGGMGRGDDALGATLMKSFIFSLTELDPPPEALLFFNGGVHLACEGSAALDDLSALAEKGVSINSCGACLNFYGKTDKLRVGAVTNMYAILAAMAGAKKLINL